ncbi:MAG: serine/threonine-protein kinase [Candidatus Xenobia bacterium]
MSTAPRQIGPYDIVGTLRRGGAARVYLAELNGRRFALKTFPCMALVDAETRTRFNREVSIHSALHHPNVCHVEDFGSWNDGTPYIVLEHVSGETLEDLLHREAPLPLPRAADLLRQCLDGLQAIHAQGIIHRGIAPANLLVSPQGQLKILDFSLARKYGSRQITPPGVSLGALAFVSPEQIFDARTVDARADLFSVGGLGYWMLGGRLAFGDERQSKAQLLDRVTSGGFASLSTLRPGLSAAWLAWVHRLLEPEPDRRFASAADAVSAMPASSAV